MAKQVPGEEKLKEISCKIAREVFKDTLPEAYEQFDIVKRRSFPRSLKDVDLLGGPGWLELASVVLLTLHTFFLVPEVAKKIRAIIDRPPPPAEGNQEKVKLGIKQNPGFPKLIETLKNKAKEAGIETEKIDELLKSFERFIDEIPVTWILVPEFEGERGSK